MIHFGTRNNVETSSTSVEGQGDLKARISQLETLLLESIGGSVKPETILEERRRALEREWHTVQNLHEEIAVLKAELEMGKLPNEPSERRRMYMRRMDALQGKQTTLEAEVAALRQNCKEVSCTSASGPRCKAGVSLESESREGSWKGPHGVSTREKLLRAYGWTEE
jgi:hypothetical protein